MTNQQFIDAVLDRPVKVKTRRNLIIDNLWEDLKANRITPFEYNKRYNKAIKLTEQNI